MDQPSHESVSVPELELESELDQCIGNGFVQFDADGEGKN